VEATFAHVDSLLQSIERVAQADLSPFAREQVDFSPDEARLIQSFISLARVRMLGALDQLGIARPRGKISARWSTATSLTLAEVALTELEESNLTGYGAVDADTAGELEALAADLRNLIRRARQSLQEHDAVGLSTRIASIPGAAGDLLRAVDTISRKHALAEVRPLLAAAVERATSTTFDVGVFGRMSAGKSSLINALVGEPILPVGATPVTAVPLRLARGQPGAVLHLLDGTHREIAQTAIAEYATEEHNQGNRIGVRAIEITVPSIPEGLRLLDTPGVGSLNAQGPASAFAWLPRCDLGLVLIAAGTAVGRDDLALTTGLAHAGISCMALLSKADLLSPEDVERVSTYVQRALGAAIEVHAVSTAVGAESRLDAFRHEVLSPLARDYVRHAKRALTTRLRRLVETTTAALAARGDEDAETRDGFDANAESFATLVEEQAMRVQRARTEAMTTLRRVTDRIGDTRTEILAAAVDAVVLAWTENRDGRDAARAAIMGCASNALGVIRESIDRVRSAARENSSDVGALEGILPDETDRRRIPPLFDPEFLDKFPPMPPPPIVRRLLGRKVALHRLEPISDSLRVALQRYGNALYEWGRTTLDELATAASDDSWSVGYGNPPISSGGGKVPELETARRALAELDTSTG